MSLEYQPAQPAVSSPDDFTPTDKTGYFYELNDGTTVFAADKEEVFQKCPVFKEMYSADPELAELTFKATIEGSKLLQEEMSSYLDQFESKTDLEDKSKQDKSEHSSESRSWDWFSDKEELLAAENEELDEEILDEIEEEYSLEPTDDAFERLAEDHLVQEEPLVPTDNFWEVEKTDTVSQTELTGLTEELEPEIDIHEDTKIEDVASDSFEVSPEEDPTTEILPENFYLQEPPTEGFVLPEQELESVSSAAQNLDEGKTQSFEEGVIWQATESNDDVKPFEERFFEQSEPKTIDTEQLSKNEQELPFFEDNMVKPPEVVFVSHDILEKHKKTKIVPKGLESLFHEPETTFNQEVKQADANADSLQESLENQTKNTPENGQTKSEKSETKPSFLEVFAQFMQREELLRREEVAEISEPEKVQRREPGQKNEMFEDFVSESDEVYTYDLQEEAKTNVLWDLREEAKEAPIEETFTRLFDIALEEDDFEEKDALTLLLSDINKDFEADDEDEENKHPSQKESVKTFFKFLGYEDPEHALQEFTNEHGEELLVEVLKGLATHFEIEEGDESGSASDSAEMLWTGTSIEDEQTLSNEEITRTYIELLLLSFDEENDKSDDEDKTVKEFYSEIALDKALLEDDEGEITKQEEKFDSKEFEAEAQEFDLEEFEEQVVEVIKNETPITLSEVRENIEEKELDEVFVELTAAFLTEKLESQEEMSFSEITEALHEAIDEATKEDENGEEVLSLTPKVVKKAYILLEFLGYENPKETLVKYAKENSIDSLLKLLKQMGEIKELKKKKTFENVLWSVGEEKHVRPTFEVVIPSAPLTPVFLTAA